MELKELVDKTTQLFSCKSVKELGKALMDCVEKNDHKKMQEFSELVENDLTKDWLQMIFQYYSADRKEKKQDYTPKSLARFMGMLAGDGETITDMCAGSGALIIQKWNQNHDMEFRAIEIDGNVIPFLLFNMVLRNIRCDVYQMDALTDEEPIKTWTIKKGEVFGCIT